ncbi:cold shock domain-containing protein [Nonomuraea sp. NPDC050404]|uniref:cold shock domain-containing protein n=1 Tax=Nonomuraea sp. NPDC050404 TaxID=3155783 RepID=UPI0033F120B9
MVTGKIISFDEYRGFGFIAPDRGGEDVFLHVNDLDGDKRLISVDTRVEFMVENGGKGLKAAHARVLDRPAAPKITLPPVSLPATPTPATIASIVSPGPAAPAPVPAQAPAPDGQANDAGFCDVLSAREFTQEITEAVLAAVPTMTAEQILGVRACLIDFARAHGWVDE